VNLNLVKLDLVTVLTRDSQGWCFHIVLDSRVSMSVDRARHWLNARKALSLGTFIGRVNTLRFLSSTLPLNGPHCLH
jgi:hypothetical protein